MTRRSEIPVIDLFAGPGGLCEGFSSIFDETGARRFAVKVPVEKDPFAHRTLLLRAIFRKFPKGKVTDLAKTVADCFSFMRRVGLDVAIEALHTARFERGVSVEDLWRGAKAAGADGIMRPYLEVIG